MADDEKLGLWALIAALSVALALSLSVVAVYVYVYGINTLVDLSALHAGEMAAMIIVFGAAGILPYGYGVPIWALLATEFAIPAIGTTGVQGTAIGFALTPLIWILPVLAIVALFLLAFFDQVSWWFAIGLSLAAVSLTWVAGVFFSVGIPEQLALIYGLLVVIGMSFTSSWQIRKTGSIRIILNDPSAGRSRKRRQSRAS